MHVLERAELAEVPTVVCVLKSGGEFTVEHVQKLYASVFKHWPVDLPLRFVVLTDLVTVDWGDIEARLLTSRYDGWWSKLDLYSAQHDDLGLILYIDLDTIIVDSLEDIVCATRSFDAPIMLEDFYKPECISAGFMALPRSFRPEVQAAILEFDHVQRIDDRFTGDSDFMNFEYQYVALRWQALLEGQIVSYKVDIRKHRATPIDRQTIPRNARVICFHGRPRPWDTHLWEK